MKDFYEKTEYAYEDILSLISNEVEESIYLDFKDARALDKSENKRKEISKDIASFANSDGGIIIYGITEENHKANSVTFIDGNEFTKEWIEQIINSTIQRRIANVLVFPIRYNGDISKTIYVVKIPKSFDAPHLSRDKRFYKRFNFESVQMEEYEIRQSYGQKLKSKLVIEQWSVSANKGKLINKDQYEFECEVQIANDGDITESTYKVNFYILNFPRHLSISYPLSTGNYNHTTLDEKKKISSNSTTPIFPDEVISAMRFNILIPVDKFDETVKDLKGEAKLFYPGGEDDMEVSMEKFLRDIVEQNT